MNLVTLHDALQLSAVSMIYALGLVVVIRGVHVMRGEISSPSAVMLLALGAYLVVKGVKHTWFTAEMMAMHRGSKDAFATHLEIPMALDMTLLALGSAVLFLAARSHLGGWTAPAITVSMVLVILLGVVIVGR